MKVTSVLPLAALCSAFILPQEEVLAGLTVEDHHGHTSVDDWVEKAGAAKDDVLSSIRNHYDDVTETSKNAWEELSSGVKSVMDKAFEEAGDAASLFGDKLSEASGDVESWFEETIDESIEGHGHRPHRDHPHRPHEPPHHHQPNETVYQLIAGSKYTTKLAKLISEYDDLVTALNTTAANFTVFAPTDKAFEKIPEKAPKPSKEQLKAILSYHVLPGLYPAGRVLSTHTAPTLLKAEHLSSQLAELQRVAFKISLRGLTVNFYSRIVAVNIFGTNGIIHGVDSIILPPPKAIDIVDLFPGEFSTLELGLGKTGLLEKMNTTEHSGGTFFAPSNFAFQKLGPKINAFLFSQYGQKYLKALLEYHLVPGTILYSDAIYQSHKNEDVDAQKELPRKGLFHIDLPTTLKDRSLSVDIGRYGGFISIRINGFATVSVQDAIAEDGVIQVTSDVLIPPKKIGNAELEHWDGSELTVEDLKQRLEPLVAKSDL